MNLEEFNVKVDALFKQAVKGELTYESLKHVLRLLCDKFESDLTVESEEFESDTTIIFLCGG